MLKLMRPLGTWLVRSVPKRSLISASPRPPAFLLQKRFPQQVQQSRSMASGEGQDIHIEELRKLQKDKSVLIIDVREKSEIAETGVLPGGINIPLGELPEALSKSPEEFEKLYNQSKPDKDTKIVFSCRSGRRSLVGLNKARELGYTNLLNFAGGWLEWEQHMKKN